MSCPSGIGLGGNGEDVGFCDSMVTNQQPVDKGRSPISEDLLSSSLLISVGALVSMLFLVLETWHSKSADSDQKSHMLLNL